ncbi:porin [Cupriavidus sp. USMAA2-4]|uniref:Porin n=1 Tax=Cupriavidus malaysiensis TaxID=367825 RepID=A0ABM6FE00_9BURK|nr:MULTISPECIES: porin [Cupriavidus]AOY94574.1 porin [Cupriavidus sp. USMAA2-4]AOZ10071.1 porin [Cupriavidus malaysiensis]
MKRAGACLVAALGAGAGTASAQSGVTLYGVADVYMEYVKSGANHAMRIEDGGLYQSRWGLRGKEELASGLAAVFNLETGLALDSGNVQQGGRLFGRQAWVGLSSTTWGALTLGRQNTPIYYIEGQASAFGFSPYGPLGRLQNSGPAGSSLTARADNSIRYETPEIAGLQASALFSFGAERTGPPRDADWLKAVGLTYSRGPLWLGLAYERTYSIAAVANADRDERAIGATYELPWFKLFVNGRQATRWVPGQATLKDRGFHVGATIPAGPAGLVLLAYGMQRSVDTPNRGQQASIGYQYSLSKRTTLYANASKIWNKNKANYTFSNVPNEVTPGGVSNPQGIMAGMRHLF